MSQLEPTLQSLKGDLNTTWAALVAMQRALQCEPVHSDYQQALSSLCRPML